MCNVLSVRFTVSHPFSDNKNSSAKKIRYYLWSHVRGKKTNFKHFLIEKIINVEYSVFCNTGLLMRRIEFFSFEGLSDSWSV